MLELLDCPEKKKKIINALRDSILFNWSPCTSIIIAVGFAFFELLVVKKQYEYFV